MISRQTISRHRGGTCVVALLLGLLSLSAQDRPQLAPLPANPLRSSDTDLNSLLPGEDIKLNPAVPPELPASDSRSTPKHPPAEIRPVLPPLPSAFGSLDTLGSSLLTDVKGFRFKGNSVFRKSKLQETVARFVNHKVTGAELEQARQELTLLYVNAGYINSGAILEDQDLKDGIVVFTIIEGRLTEVKVSGNWWMRSWWLKRGLFRDSGRPLNMNKLKQGLELLRQNPNIAQVNAELMPGGKPGESILDVKVKENEPFHLSLDFSNRRSPSVGAEILELNASMLSLTGHGDPLTLRYGPLHSSSENMDKWTWDGKGNIEGSYQFPISPWKTTLELHASRNDASVVEEALLPLDISSQTKQYGATLRQPLYETLNNTLAMSATLDYRKNNTFLLGQPFSLSDGALDGETKVFVLRLALEYVQRSEAHVLSLRSTFNIGLDAFGATTRQAAATDNNGQGMLKLADGQFFAWVGQGQYVQRLFNTDNLAILRINAFLSNNPMPSLEQFSIGGMQSVRGYRENELLRDNGVFGSLEFHVPVWRKKDKSAILTVVPFFDIGCGWNNVEYIASPPAGGIDRQYNTLASVGTGLIFTPSKHVNMQIYWGYALNRDFVVKDGKNLQDYGLHFSMSIIAF